MSNGKKFRPSNSDHGVAFASHFCDWCSKESGAEGESCGILFRSLIYDIDAPEYPAEWTYDATGSPVCTAFTHV